MKFSKSSWVKPMVSWSIKRCDQIAHYSGLEASYGDILRRAISGKGRSLKELQSVKDQFFFPLSKVPIN
jgi:hypothetical protein